MDKSCHMVPLLTKQDCARHPPVKIFFFDALLHAAPSAPSPPRPGLSVLVLPSRGPRVADPTHRSCHIGLASLGTTNGFSRLGETLYMLVPPFDAPSSATAVTTPVQVEMKPTIHNMDTLEKRASLRHPLLPLFIMWLNLLILGGSPCPSNSPFATLRTWTCT